MDSLQAEYEAKQIATALNLQRYYNECVGVMLAKEDGDMTPDEVLDALQEIDKAWAKRIVDDISPKKSILV